MKQFFLQATVVIVGIVIGGATGGYLTFHRYARDFAVVRAFAWTGIVSAVSVNQYDMNTSDAKAELLYSLDFYSQGVGSSAIDATMKNALRMNRGLTAARLSVLENEAGNVDLSKTYLAKAQEDLKATGWIDYSESNILQAVKRKTVVPCGSAPQNAAKTNTTSEPCG
jgi:hypothetical protein